MRFMTIENWFDHNGAFHEASPEQPHVFDYPEGMVPNWRWFPLDKKAEAALADMAKENRHIRVHKLFVPDGALPEVEVIDPPEAPEDAKPKLPPRVPAASTLSEMQKGLRPSDKEP